MLRFFVCVILMLGVMVGVILLEGGNPIMHLGLVLVIIFVLVPFFASLAVWKLKELNQVWKDTFTKEKKGATLKTSLKILDFHEKLYYPLGFITFIIGLVMVLSNMTDLPKIGTPLAYSLNSILYGLWLGMVTRIMKARVLNKLEE